MRLKDKSENLDSKSSKEEVTPIGGNIIVSSGVHSSSDKDLEKIREEILERAENKLTETVGRFDAKRILNIPKELGVYDELIQKAVKWKEKEFEKYEIEQLIPLEKDKEKFVEEQARADQKKIDKKEQDAELREKMGMLDGYQDNGIKNAVIFRAILEKIKEFRKTDKWGVIVDWEALNVAITLIENMIFDDIEKKGKKFSDEKHPEYGWWIDFGMEEWQELKKKYGKLLR
jgi:hypothetical protein